ncbi:hypothetical protein GCM10009125_00350 [Castellaniella daejeonensis]|uniref:Tail assembly chaperone n=1 Tax=Castellaniella daejeonensis TaxID=659013 RepID=A0ABN0T8M9_9BURK
MKYFKSPAGEVFAFESDGSQDAWINPDLVQMTPEEVEAHLNPPQAPYIPQVVTRAQGKAALIGAGLWDDVLAYVDGIADPTQQALARVALDDTTEWRRDSPSLATAAAALGLSDDDLDGLFVAAAGIVL